MIFWNRTRANIGKKYIAIEPKSKKKIREKMDWQAEAAAMMQ